jgi:hypothetical protein
MAAASQDVQSHELRPGDQLHFVNARETAIQIKVATACGTETLIDLHPGAKVQVTVGTMMANIYIMGTDEDYTGLQVVR